MAYKDPDKQSKYHKKWKSEHKEEYREYNRKWVSNNRDKQKASNLKHKYDMKLSEFNLMRELQGDRCIVCDAGFTTSPCVDHCHVTGKVRGLLCATCNLMLGYAQDDPSILRRAAEYLEKQS
jgi:hypothetical protein